jgi:hypothetical protein
MGMIFIPFSFKFLSFQSSLSRFLFHDLVNFIGDKLPFVYIANPEITSDSSTFYLLIVLLFLIALILSVVCSFVPFWQTHRKKIILTIQLAMTYYLSLIMLKYGFDKVFKAQFYLPEPNTLYTPLGMLDKDILYWSTMGLSRSYNIFLGCLEVLPAILLLFHKTRNIGLLILFGVLTHVVWVNFSFDISVKMYASFLLLLTILLILPNAKPLLTIFVSNSPSKLKTYSGAYLFESKGLRLVLKTSIIVIFAIEALGGYIWHGNFNDDEVPRNYLHGAYNVVAISTHSPNIELPEIKRLFVHRRDYFIMQYADDTMEDFKLIVDSSENTLTLITYEGEELEFTYSFDNVSGELIIRNESVGINIETIAIPWKELPVLQPLFHWTVDGVE